MSYLSRKGKRIRPSDNHLVFYSLLFLFLLSTTSLLTLFHLNFLRLANFSKDDLIHHFMTDYTLGTCILSILFGILTMCLFYHFRLDTYKSLTHRQKLARMILENGWYETKQVEDFDIFSSTSKMKEKISYFPKMYYQMKNGLIHISVEITLGKYQDQLLKLENKLETGLFCELIYKELKDSYIDYTLLYDTIANRISIEDVLVQNGSMKLMSNISWSFDSLPHMLIAGGTGGGKTYFLLTIIESLLKTNAKLFILDPKNADLADLSTVMDNVYYKQEDISACVHDFYSNMMARSTAIKLMDTYKTGENYAYLGLEPNFLIFDEYVAFMEMLSNKESMEVINKLKQIVMLGRQAGFFIILACQRPDAKYLQDGIRDQFNFRVALGRMSELGYSMMFGDVDKGFFLKQIKGRGYVDVGTNVISEFYTPLVPKGHDFLETISQLVTSKDQEEINGI